MKICSQRQKLDSFCVFFFFFFHLISCAIKVFFYMDFASSKQVSKAIYLNYGNILKLLPFSDGNAKTKRKKAKERKRIILFTFCY